MLNGLAFYFADGRMYYFGWLLVCTAVLCYLVREKPVRIIANLLLLIGLAFVFLSSIPAPVWFYCLSAAALGAWLVVRGRLGATKPKAKYAATAAVLALGLLGMAMEAWHRRGPHLGPPTAARIYVIGDSLSAGMGGPEMTWPAMLAEHGIEVQNLARPGATSESALAQARGVTAGSAIIIVEIGGNDFFARVPAADFERHLEALLQRLQNPDRRLVMFELPIPLLGHRYGYAQRRLADLYDVALIPRQVLAQAIAAPGATVDGLHFSAQGHRHMADTVWPMVQDAVQITTPKSQL